MLRYTGIVFVVVLVITALVLGAPQRDKNSFSPKQRIVGGYDANIRDYPYDVGIVLRGEYKCGGVILNEIYVLTTVRCVSILSISARVVSNTTVWSTPGAESSINKVYFHGLYNQETLENDIAILELVEPIPLGPGAQPVKLAEPNEELLPGSMATVSGWMAPIFDYPDPPDNLMSLSVDIISHEDCVANYTFEVVADSTLCTGIPGGITGFCDTADLGDALVANGTLYGLYSWQYGCNDLGYVSVFTKISAFRDFIYTVTGL